MTRAHRFDARTAEDVITLLQEQPLAWIFLQDESGPFVTPAPIRPVIDKAQLIRLTGHVPRNSRIGVCLRTCQTAAILVVGPDGYISPSWLSDRTQAPTWNFASTHFVTDIQIVDDPEYLEEHLRDLTSAMEKGRHAAWSIDEMDARLDVLVARIVAFDARITATVPRFKLGQDESDQSYGEITQALEFDRAQGLLAWMRKFNPSRS